MNSPRLLPTATALSLIAVLAGCRDAQISSYKIPKEAPPAAAPAANPHAHADTAATPAPAGAAAAAQLPPASPPAMPAKPDAAMASTPVATAGGALGWTAPAHWTSKAGSSMRKGTYIIKGSDGAEAELAITAFPGNVGGDLANVNRWRGQLQLQPIDAAQLERDLVRFTANSLAMAMIDIPGAPGATAQRMLGGIVPHAGATWFFKLTGPDALVVSQKDAFIAFLKSVRVP
jgi:hypothetical protein